MTTHLLPFTLCVLAAVLVGASAAEKTDADAAPATTSKVAATSIPTFHCLGLYWSPEQGAVGKSVLVKFRAVGQKKWSDGLPMRYNPVASEHCKADYRGSLVNLVPDTTYDIALTLEGTEIHTTLKAKTWSESFPIAKTITVPSGSTMLECKQSGKPDGYILYDGTGCTLDGKNAIEQAISVSASYVIFRGFTIKNTTAYGIRIWENQHHIVIENCDLSKWGSTDEKGFGVDFQGAVNSNKKNVHNIIVQRCRIHHPNYDSNSWAEDHNNSRHPAGQQAIVLWDSPGNNVFRYNECWSDPDHYFNDVLGGSYNGSYTGYPGADSDIYGNYVANCWDDGIESEGGNQNVRIWNNYTEEVMIPIANAATSIGPLYVWQNVSGRSYSPPGSEFNMTHGPFMKMGYAGDAKWMTGHMYIFNNTIFQPNNEGADALGSSSRIIKHCISRNNLFCTRTGDSHSISTDKRSEDNDFDYDLVSGRYPDGHQAHGTKGRPTFIANAGFTFDTKTGIFQLAPDSPGAKQGIVIPNFCDATPHPDMGAHAAGAKPLLYGVKATFIPTTSSTSRKP